jgi:signal transduction histidine kinase
MRQEMAQEAPSSGSSNHMALDTPPCGKTDPPSTVDGAGWALPLPMAVLDRHGLILAVNDAWERHARDTVSAQLVMGSHGWNYLRLLQNSTPIEHAERIEQRIREALASGASSFSFEYVTSSAIAAVHRYLFHVSPLPSQQGGAMLAQIELGSDISAVVQPAPVLARAALPLRDATQQGAKRAHVGSLTAERQLARLRWVMDSALSQLPVEQLIEETVERIKHVLSADNVTVLLVADDGQSLLAHTSHGVLQDVGVRVPLGAGIAGHIAASSQPLIVADLSKYQVVNPALRQRIVSLIGAPMLVGGRVVGIVHADTVLPRHFSREDLEVVQAGADRIAAALEQVHLAHEREVVQARLELVELRANQLDAAIETMTDALLVIDRDRHVVRWNRAYHDMMAALHAPGTDTTPLAGRLRQLHVRDSTGARLRSAQYPVARVLRGEVLNGATVLDLHIPVPEGGDRELIVSGAPVRDPAGHITGAVVMLHDITERQLDELRTRQALQALLAMAELLTGRPSMTGSEPSSVEPLMRRLAELAVQILDGDSVALAALDSATDRLGYVVVVPSSQTEANQVSTAVDASTLSDVLTPTQMAELKAGHLIVHDKHVTADSVSGSRLAWDVMAPMCIGPRFMGALCVAYRNSHGAPGADDRALAAATARVAAVALDHQQLQREHEEGRSRELALKELTQRMDDFLAIASHDLRSPLTTVVGSVQLAAIKFNQLAAKLLERDSDLSEPLEAVNRYLNDADQSVERLSRLVALLFDTSRAQTGSLDLKLAPCDLGPLVQQHIASERLSNPDRTIHVKRRSAASIVVQADADRVEEVLANYLSNALKYSPSNRAIEVSVTTEGAAARVSVKDHGPGIPADELARIWERFYRAKGIRAQSGSASGLGLGLHICKMIIEAHGGHVGATSTVGKGSTFWFTLPLLVEKT